jgi:hypothetical protein
MKRQAPKPEDMLLTDGEGLVAELVLATDKEISFSGSLKAV